MNHLKQIAGRLPEYQIDAMLISSEPGEFYAVGLHGEGFAVAAPGAVRYITDSRYIEVARETVTDAEVVMVDGGRNYFKLINEFLDAHNIKTLGIEESYMSLGQYEQLKRDLHARLVPAGKLILDLRAAKDEEELARMVKAQEITDISFTEILTKIRTGMTEKELCAELIYCLLKNGADGLSFDPIVVSGPNTSMPHGVPGDRKLQEGDFITMDFGVLYQGYCSDMTRTVALGYATEEMKEVYEVVRQAQLAGIAATKAGAQGKQIDGAARKVIADAGYGEFFGHGYGHSLGLEIHEAPNCNAAGELPMPAGAVCSAEPGIYLPGKFGVRIEDVVVFREDGCEILTKSPKNLIVV